MGSCCLLSREDGLIGKTIDKALSRRNGWQHSSLRLYYCFGKEIRLRTIREKQNIIDTTVQNSASQYIKHFLDKYCIVF